MGFSRGSPRTALASGGARRRACRLTHMGNFDIQRGGYVRFGVWRSRCGEFKLWPPSANRRRSAVQPATRVVENVIAEFGAAVVKASIAPGSGAPSIVVEADAPKKCAKLGMEPGKTSPGCAAG
jgi:hypothetical protein